MKRLGARVTTNAFGDPHLRLSDNAFSNLVAIIRSGRRQEFERITLNLKADTLPHVHKDAAALAALERVVIHVGEAGPTLTLMIYYPEVIWAEAAYWPAKARTDLHPKHLSPSELDRLKVLLSLSPFPTDDYALLLKALDLDGL